MNTNPNAKRILCFGDSNTRGWIPLTMNDLVKRYSENVRWTGVLQNMLGENFEIIEEGLDARTTITDDPRPELSGRNGSEYLFPCLESHKPLDLVIIMLGTTECKEMMNLTPEKITGGMEILIETIKSSNAGNPNGSPKILLMSPPALKEEVEFASKLFKGGTEKSRALGKFYKTLAEKHECEFLNTAEFIESSDRDGVHLDPEEHEKLAKAIYEKVQHIFELDKIDLVAETENFKLIVHPNPEIDRLDGGHMKIVPKFPFKDRTEMDPNLGEECFKFTILAGKAFKSGMKERGIELFRINYQDNGNWNPKFHIHLYGRAKNAKYYKAGEAYVPPTTQETRKKLKKFEKLNADDVKAIQKYIIEFSKESGFEDLLKN